MHPLLADPWIAAQVEDAVRPWVGRLSAGEIAWMRDQLAETLATDERAAQLLHRARPRVVEESGEVRRGTHQDAGTNGQQRRAAGDGTVTPITRRKGRAG
jgi:hypothetical protein